MREEDRERLVEFLRRKMCGPCRSGDLNLSHEGCTEAADLIVIVEADDSSPRS